MSIDHREQEVAVPKRMIPPWLLYSLLTILLWGVWGATSKAVANDINPYMNQVLFTIGLVPVLSLVVRCCRKQIVRTEIAVRVLALVAAVLLYP